MGEEERGEIEGRVRGGRERGDRENEVGYIDIIQIAHRVVLVTREFFPQHDGEGTVHKYNASNTPETDT